MPYPNHDFVWRCFIWTGEGVLYHWITIKSPWNPIKLPWNQRYQHLSTLNHPSFPYISIYFHIFPYISIYFHIFPYIYWLMNQPSYQPDTNHHFRWKNAISSPAARRSSQPCRQRFLRRCRPFHSWVAIRRSGAEILWKSMGGNPWSP